MKRRWGQTGFRQTGTSGAGYSRGPSPSRPVGYGIIFQTFQWDFMNIQIFGTLKCQDTKKAQRYFKERRIPFQFIDITQKGLSKGELNSLKTTVGIDNLIDYEGKAYGRKNLKYLTHDIEEELLKDAALLKTPVVRNGREATVGYQPEIWKTWK
jgi:arsenate reductase (glutaredoxin)